MHNKALFMATLTLGLHYKEAILIYCYNTAIILLHDTELITLESRRCKPNNIVAKIKMSCN